MYLDGLTSTVSKKLGSFLLVLAIVFVQLSPAVAYADFDAPPAEEPPQTEQQDPEPQQEEQVEEEPQGDTDNGEGGTNGGDESTDENTGEDGDAAGGTEIETGNGGSNTDVENTVNYNETTTTQSSDDDITATTTDDGSDDNGDVTGGNTTITGDNDGTVENNTNTGSDTGANEADGGDGDVVIETGAAFASTNVVNVVNTNIVNSQGILLFLQEMFASTLDVTDIFNDFGQSANEAGAPCSLDYCNNPDAEYNVANDNDAAITNDVVVRSNTGGNIATSNGDTAGIWTGDAYAAANVVNVANTNIVDSNYLLVTLNNVGDLGGDIVLPGASFFEDLLNSGAGLSYGQTVTNTNTATIANNATTTADTGNNAATSTGDGADGAVVTTGDADAHSGVTNVINTNQSGGSSLVLMFRVFGDWTGNVFGLPDGVSWSETDNGIQIMGGGSGSGAGLPSGTTVANNNDASITNNVEVLALTGDNKASGEEAEIHTGDAYAAANIINVVNTNVVGQNWIFAIFNIFGDFKGDIAFGRPDLWIGASASAPGAHIRPGETVHYNFTIANLGNSDATNVVLDLEFHEGLIQFPGAVYNQELDTYSLYLGTIEAGETIEISEMGFLNDQINTGSTSVVLDALVSSFEDDNDMSDNKESISIVVENDRNGGTEVVLTPRSNLHVEKTASATVLDEPGLVDYTIVITNEGGGSAYHSELFDTLVDHDGNVVHEQSWWLGEILPDEEITVTYTVDFKKPGNYTNSAEVKAITLHPSVEPFYGNFGHSNIVAKTIHVQPTEPQSSPVPQLDPPVVAAAPQCTEYLSAYIGTNRNNDPAQVTLLQEFLRDYEGHTNLAITGEYDQATFDAVVAFQTKYQNDILGPWNAATPSGFVYHTTRKKINEIYCNGDKKFPLTQEQLSEIRSFHQWTNAHIETGAPRPDTSNIGFNSFIPFDLNQKREEEESVLSLEYTDTDAQTASVLNSGALSASGENATFTAFWKNATTTILSDLFTLVPGDYFNFSKKIK